MVTLHVFVKEEHISSGIPKDCGNCPIALALIDLGYHSVHIEQEEFQICKDKQWYAGYLPVEATNFIKQFDQSDVCKVPILPFDFSISLYTEEY
jgi:hypothetical protein